MIALVSDILQLSELDSTQASQSREKPAEMAPVDLAALLKETAQNMTVNARKAYVTLQYSAQPATCLLYTSLPKGALQCGTQTGTGFSRVQGYCTAPPGRFRP